MIRLTIAASLLFSVDAFADTTVTTLDHGRISLQQGPLVGISALNLVQTAGKTSVAAGQDAGGGYELTLSAWPASDGNDRLHLSLAGMFGGGVQDGKTIASFTLGLLPGFGGFEHVPLFSIGPAVRIPFNSSLPASFEILATGSVVSLLALLSGSSI